MYTPYLRLLASGIGLRFPYMNAYALHTHCIQSSYLQLNHYNYRGSIQSTTDNSYSKNAEQIPDH